MPAYPQLVALFFHLDGRNGQLERPRGETRVQLPIQLELRQHELERVDRAFREGGRIVDCRGPKVVPEKGGTGQGRIRRENAAGQGAVLGLANAGGEAE